MNNIPKDIFRDNILPFTYCIQPIQLRQDLLSYHKTIQNVKEIYQQKFPTTIDTPSEDSDLAWLSNDISRFLNNDWPIQMDSVTNYMNRSLLV